MTRTRCHRVLSLISKRTCGLSESVVLSGLLIKSAAREQLATKRDAELLQRFDAAEQAWEQYAEQGIYLYFCPIPGISARYAFFGVTLPLYAQHERFLKTLSDAKQQKTLQ